MSFLKSLKKILVGDAPVEVKQNEKTKVSVTEEKAAPSKYVNDGTYKRCIVAHGKRGWGGPLEIAPTKERNLIYSVTGGGIHPVAQRIADITGGIAFDGFRSKADFDQIAVAVIDCGGTARVGVYPMKGVLTVDIYATTPSGPLAKFINEKNFVSGIKETDITLIE